MSCIYTPFYPLVEDAPAEFIAVTDNIYLCQSSWNLTANITASIKADCVIAGINEIYTQAVNSTLIQYAGSTLVALITI